MKVFYSGVGNLRETVNKTVEQPNCPQIGETVFWEDRNEYDVKHVASCPFTIEYDVYVVLAE